MGALFVSHRQPTLGHNSVKLGQLPDAMICRVSVRVRVPHLIFNLNPPATHGVLQPLQRGLGSAIIIATV